MGEAVPWDGCALGLGWGRVEGGQAPERSPALARPAFRTGHSETLSALGYLARLKTQQAVCPQVPTPEILI